MNKVILVGNLGQDPELKFANSGNGILQIRMATKERVKLEDGSYGDGSEWHNVVMFGKRAESLGKILRKGDRIAVDGSLQTRSWEKDGVKRYATEVKTFDIELLGGNKGAPQEQKAESGGGFDDGDIPFAVPYTP